MLQDSTLLLLFLFSFFLLETKRDRVNAVALPGWRRSILKNMTEVASAARANNFDTVHGITGIFLKPDSVTGNHIIETWPATPGFKFGIGRK